MHTVSNRTLSALAYDRDAGLRPRASERPRAAVKRLNASVEGGIGR